MKTNVLMIAMASAMLATSVTTNSTAKTVSETATTRQQTDSTTFKGCCGMCKNRNENAGDMNKMMEHADEMHQEAAPMMKARSEEHTSELQSLMRISYAVVCL